ncbi:MAG: DUF4249 domain-containing protein [Bacteroidetes bacterium]|nr:MAG: DUF4249 domain-containing protein [Bacteroidota bacterium]
MSKFLIYSLLLLTLVLSACEEAFEIDPRQVEETIVIESTLSSTPSQPLAFISLSGSLSEAGNFRWVDNAELSMSTASGGLYPASLADTGVYIFPGLTPVSGETYTLDVNYEGKNYRASSYLHSPQPIDSLSFEYRGEGPIREAGYMMSAHFTPPSSDLYMRFWVSVNGRPLYDYFLYNGWQEGGDAGLYIFRTTAFEPGDSIVVTAAVVDQEVYTYYDQLSALAGSAFSSGSAAPANPQSNFSGGALGYFAALGISTKQAVVK